MKKGLWIGGMLLATLIVMILVTQQWQDTATLLSLVFMIAVFIVAFGYFERSRIGAKEIACIATLSAFTAMSRVVFAPIPNVQPMTFLVALCGLVFGPFEGLMVGCSAAFVSNIFLGQGPWTPWQMLLWGLIGFIAGVWGKSVKSKPNTIVFSIVCVGFSFLFGWVMNLWTLLTFVKPITWQSVLTTYLASTIFDIMHAGGSFLFSLLFFDKLYRMLSRYQHRLEITYLKGATHE